MLRFSRTKPAAAAVCENALCLIFTMFLLLYESIIDSPLALVNNSQTFFKKIRAAGPEEVVLFIHAFAAAPGKFNFEAFGLYVGDLVQGLTKLIAAPIVPAKLQKYKP